MIRSLHGPLFEYPAFQKAQESLRSCGHVFVDGCVPSQKLHFASALAADARNVLIVTHSDLRAREIREEYSFYSRNTVLFPAKDLIFYQADLKGREIETERLKCLRRIMEGRPVCVVTTFAALMTPQIPLYALKEAVLEVTKGGQLDLEETTRRLVEIGYVKNYQAEQPGQFAVRGDILDVFDLTEESPYRIELWGDEVESIRSFDALTQRTTSQLTGIRIYPATELVLSEVRLTDGIRRIRDELADREKYLRDRNMTEEAHRLKTEVERAVEEAQELQDHSRLESFIKYFYPHTSNLTELFSTDHTVVFLDEPARLKEHADAVLTEFRESMVSRAEKGYILPGQMDLLLLPEQVLAGISKFRRAGLAELLPMEEYFETEPSVRLNAKSVSSYNKSFDMLREDLMKARLAKYRVVLISPSRTRARRLALDLMEQGITAFYSESPDRVPQEGEVMTYYGRVLHGFEYPSIKFLVIAESDIFGTEKRRKKKTHRYEGEKIKDFSELRPGDYVVHEDHGVGIYRGVEKIEIDHVAKDYVKIEYGGGGTLYVLPTELDVLQKYAAAGGAAKPKLNKLGTQEWSSTKNKVRSAVDEVAEDLVELYAKRQRTQGHSFGRDTVWQREFEEMFPYEETEDQLTAIADTKRDMESGRIMDRLICGDVGYGKTEIAIRAAFKAVQDSRQVAVLVPTTILAQQHYNTFTERMKNYPVKIGLLSRFRTAAEQKKTLRELAAGSVDIVIGTHRLLSKDVKFKDLGLLVVDEEQRFGVAHKEKIKKMREDVDVLTLSATPIPRTLHMSLVGIRDMSVLEEAPEDRVPIQTYVMEYNEEMVREAVVRELSRSGQVYYVYNRTADIAEMAGKLQKLIPEARVGYAHGQMSEGDLEKIMYEFIRGEIDVLVSTTIIETGLDISNVNTIVIHDSDQMGLSQLYQLRGRVGRSDRTAYAFLMYKKDKMLKEIAEKRLSAIREYTDLGSGFRIAMRDLEIRGAGNILGRSQHGHMQAVGYDLYCKLLDTAIRKAKGDEREEEKACSVNLSVDAFIPADYILNEAQKLEIYKRIASIGGTEDCDDVRDEMIDRYGEIPAPARNLLRIALIRAIARHLDITEISGFFAGSEAVNGMAAGSEAVIRIVPDAKANLRVESIPALISRYNGRRAGKADDGTVRGTLSFTAKGVPAFTYTFKPTGLMVKDEEMLLSATEDLLVNMAEQLR